MEHLKMLMKIKTKRRVKNMEIKTSGKTNERKEKLKEMILEAVSEACGPVDRHGFHEASEFIDWKSLEQELDMVLRASEPSDLSPAEAESKWNNTFNDICDCIERIESIEQNLKKLNKYFFEREI
jgi:hypothetical protein